MALVKRVVAYGNKISKRPAKASTDVRHALKAGRSKSSGRKVKTTEPVRRHESKIDGYAAKTMKRSGRVESEQPRELDGKAKAEDKEGQVLKQNASDTVESLLDKCWEAYNDADQNEWDGKFRQAQEKLFVTMEKAGTDAYEMEERLRAEAAKLSQRRTTLRKPVRKELDQIKYNLDHDERVPHPYAKHMMENEKENKRLRRRINKKVPELAAIDSNIRKLRFLTTQMNRDYGSWESDRGEMRHKKAAKKARKNSKIVARVRHSGEEYLRAKEAFVSAYHELEGRDPDGYQFPIDHDDLTRLLKEKPEDE